MATRQATRRKPSSKTTTSKAIALPEEPEGLEEEVKRLRAENALLKKNLGMVLCGEVQIDKEALLAKFGTQPSLLELIKEIEEARD